MIQSHCITTELYKTEAVITDAHAISNPHLWFQINNFRWFCHNKSMSVSTPFTCEWLFWLFCPVRIHIFTAISVSTSIVTNMPYKICTFRVVCFIWQWKSRFFFNIVIILWLRLGVIIGSLLAVADIWCGFMLRCLIGFLH